jgi:hypothetical protein
MSEYAQLTYSSADMERQVFYGEVHSGGALTGATILQPVVQSANAVATPEFSDSPRIALGTQTLDLSPFGTP